MTGNEQSAAPRRKVSQLAAFAHALLLLLLFGAGFFIRGILPSGPPGQGPGGPGAHGEDGPPPVVETAIVKEGPAQAPMQYVGHIEAMQEVDISAQVAGYLDEVFFEEGAMVNRGELLFRIEQDQYKARVALSEAALSEARAGLDAANAEVQRSEKLLKKLRSADARSVPKTDMDNAESAVTQSHAAVAQAEAAIKKAEASLSLARIDLAFTELRAPITGKIGKAMLTKGNYVSPASGPLAHIVQTDPIRVVTSMADRRFLDILQATAGDGAPSFDIKLQLANGAAYPLAGLLDFQDNKMNPATGAIAVRARFDNPDGLLIPGSYVTILSRPSGTAMVPLVPQQAVLNDREGASVFVVGDGDVLEQRRIKVGDPLENQQIVLEGLSVGERIVVRGLQRAKDGLKVTVAAAPEA